MLNTALKTSPLSDYEALSTLWAAECAAPGTDLRGEALVNFDVLGPVPDGLVAELGSKLRPAGIEDRLRHAGPGEARGVDVPDDDTPVLTDKPRGEFVQKMLAAVSYLGVDGTHSDFTAGALRAGELRGVSGRVPRIDDLLAAREHREMLETEVDADLARATVLALGDLDLEIEIPASPGILREAATFDCPVHRTTQPQSITALEEDYGIAVQADRTRGLERNPAQGPPAAPSGSAAVRIARVRELLADRLHGIRVEPEIARAAVCQADQIKAARPEPVPPTRRLLRLPAEVPDEIDGAGLARELLRCSARCLEAITVGQNHAATVVALRSLYQNLDAKDTAFPISLFTWSVSRDTVGKCSTLRRSSASRRTISRHPRPALHGKMSSSTFSSNAPPPRPEGRGFRSGEFR